ncbi:MAG: RsmE family RNA methyltransferase [Planctomycetota bacterium]
MSERFFSEQPIAGDVAVLAGNEAHHLLHVMRAKAGARVVLFDGSGAEFDAEVRRGGRREVELTVLTRRAVDRELPAPLTIAAALPKGDRQRWMVEKLTELGATRFIPLLTERSVAKPTSGGLEKLRRAVVEASKQCRRNRLMEIAEPVAWRGFASGGAPTGAKWIAHPEGPPLPAGNGGPAGMAIGIGPEGGFSEEEVALAAASGWGTLGLGPRVLRTETAATAAAAIAAARIEGPR